MTDPTGPQQDPEHDAVRRLLADARHTEPMPADVAARMDAVLADLAKGETPPVVADDRPVADVVPLASHRRRNAASLLVAAAAIVVGGVVVAQLPHGGGDSAGSAAGSAAGADRMSAGALGNTGNGKAPSATNGFKSEQDRRAAHPTTRHGRVVVRPGHFAADAKAGRGLLDSTAAQPLDGERCVKAASGSQVVPATYERAAAALVYHQAQGNTQVVDLYLCGHGSPVRSVTLPLP